MKAILLSALVLLAGCATQSQQDPRFAEMMTWREGARSQAAKGEIPWSRFYADAYDRVSQLPPSGHTALDMQILSEMIPIARKYEAGEITKDQLQDAQRMAGARFREGAARLDREDDAERRRAAVQILSTRPAYIPPSQAPAYQMPVPQPQQPINCNSYTSGGQIITNCR